MVLDWKLSLVGYPGEVMTDMDNSIYPDGFYQVCAKSRHGKVRAHSAALAKGCQKPTTYLNPCISFLTFVSSMQAIKRHARIGKPIIITETGIADGVDSRRELWATSYLAAVRPTKREPPFKSLFASVLANDRKPYGTRSWTELLLDICMPAQTLQKLPLPAV